MIRFITCPNCGLYLRHHAKGFCKKCYIITGSSKFGKRKYRFKLGGYYYIYKPYFKYSGKMGYVREHRYIYYIYLSIKYNRIIYLPTKKYDIHHINGNELDNRIDNLQIMTRSDHLRIHNPIIDKSNRYCNLCGGTETTKTLKKNKYYDSWLDDLEGHLCYWCYGMIQQYREKFGIISNYK